MRISMPVALAASTLATAAPTASTDFQFGTFHVTNFNYTCPSTEKLCFWNFNVTDPTNFKHHPAITESLHCSGNSSLKTFTPGSCTDPKSSKYAHINGYIKKHKGEQHLNLQYVLVPANEKQFFWFYMGNTTVKADSKGQPKQFLVNESSIVETS